MSGVTRLAPAHMSDLLAELAALRAAAERIEGMVRGGLEVRDASGADHSGKTKGGPVIDWGTFAVVFQGRRCVIGNGLPLRFFARLMRRAGQYVHRDDLIEDVWERRGVTGDAVRSVAWRLRRKLREAGMEELADAIDGRQGGCFGILPVWEQCDKITQKPLPCSAKYHSGVVR